MHRIALLATVAAIGLMAAAASAQTQTQGNQPQGNTYVAPQSGGTMNAPQGSASGNTYGAPRSGATSTAPQAAPAPKSATMAPTMAPRAAMSGSTGYAAPQAAAGTAPAARQGGNNCDPGERIDGTSATDAKRRMEAAGLANVGQLKKGCDNFWHAKAMSQGRLVGVVLSPQGQIQTETD